MNSLFILRISLQHLDLGMQTVAKSIRGDTHHLLVDGSCSLVHDEDTGLAQERTGQTEQLALANAEILTALSHKEIFQKKVKSSE